MIIEIAIKHAVTIGENETEFMGAIIEDYEEGRLWLVVEPDEVDLDATWSQTKEPHEMWGSRFEENFTEYSIRACTWNGYPVLNDEQILEYKELRYV